MIQCQALNKILSTKDFSLVIINNLNEEFFSDYKDEFRFIKEHVDRYGSVPDYESFVAKFPDFDVIFLSQFFSKFN